MPAYFPTRVGIFLIRGTEAVDQFRHDSAMHHSIWRICDILRTFLRMRHVNDGSSSDVTTKDEHIFAIFFPARLFL
jgi:hypothetical protein